MGWNDDMDYDYKAELEARENASYLGYGYISRELFNVDAILARMQRRAVEEYLEEAAE